MRYKILLLLVSSLLLFILCGCSKTIEVKEEQVVAEADVIEEETYPVGEDILDSIREKLQEEMRIFDVVAHHEEIYDLVSAEISSDDTDEEMNEKIGSIVKNYMDAYLDGRIREELTLVESQYDPNDVQWLRDHVKTSDLYQLITVYEREYYKHSNNK